ncbi:MAG: TlpA family protein disulfide reductase [Ilumatobacteraceae bacterium]
MNPKNRTLIIMLAVLGVIVVVGAVAFLLSGDDESSDGVVAEEAAGADPGEPSSTDGSDGGEAVGETFPVEVTGTPLPPLDDPSADPAVGLATPVIDGRTFDGSAMSIGGATDGPTMYVFLAHWCPHCNDEIPELIELEERGDIPDGLNIVGISTAVAADRPNYPPSEWLSSMGWPWPAMADSAESTSFTTFGGTAFPFTVMADADGTVLGRAAGSRSADDIKDWLDEVLATASA